MTEPTPAALLALAADRLRQPSGPTTPPLAEPLANWLRAAAAVVRANHIAVDAVFTDDPAGRNDWLREMQRPEPVAVARVILATTPHGAPDAPPTPRADTETSDASSGAQAVGLRARIAAAIQADAQSGHPVGIVHAVLNVVQPELDRADRAEAALDRVRELHQADRGECGTCADEDGQAARWPCDTIRAITPDTPTP